jgi:hypothetical protein
MISTDFGSEIMAATLDGATTTYTLQYGVDLSNTGTNGADELIKLSDPLIDTLSKLVANKAICHNVTSRHPAPELPLKGGPPKYIDGGNQKRVNPPVIDQLRPDDGTEEIMNEMFNRMGHEQTYQAMILRGGNAYRELGGADAPNQGQLQAYVLRWNARANVDPRFVAFVSQYRTPPPTEHFSVPLI